MGLMISVSGIRGRVGDDINPDILAKYVVAFLASLGKPKGKIIIGRDSRKSGNLIRNIVSGVIMAMGYDFLDIGIATTPTVLLSTRKLRFDGGIAITASHNPPEWNALKLCNDRGLFLDEKQIDRIVENVNNTKYRWKPYHNIGSELDRRDCNSIHIDEVLKFIDREKIKKSHFKVAIDPMGSTGTVIDRRFLELLGCEVVSINEKILDDFPRKPEPVPENIGKLCNLVKDKDAAIGFAQDPDGDRLSVVSEKGVPIGEEYTLVLAGDCYLRKNKTDLACNLSTSQMIDYLAKLYGVKVYRTKIGEINVTNKLIEKGLGFGGEGNGGVIIPQVNPCRDSIVGMGLILNLMAETHKTITQLISKYPNYKMRKIKIKITNKDRNEFYKEIFLEAKRYSSDYEIDTLDGIKIFNNKEWLHIRLSNTEPVIRVMAESESEIGIDRLLNTAKTFIKT